MKIKVLKLSVLWGIAFVMAISISACDNVSGIFNIAPAWMAVPTDVAVFTDETYNATNGEAIDINEPNSNDDDPGYVECSAANSTCSFVVRVTGSGAGSAACNVSFTAGTVPENCAVDVVAEDGYSARVSERIAIEVRKPPFGIDCSDPGPNPVSEGNLIQCTVVAVNSTAQIDALADTCGGAINGDYYEYTPGEVDGPGSCTAAIEKVEDTTEKDSGVIDILEDNQNPSWTTAPSDIVICAGVGYDADNGDATDADLPNAAAGDPGLLACSVANNTCSFGITATGGGAGAATCHLQFTDNGAETCNVDVIAEDGYGAQAVQNITVTVNPQTVSIVCPASVNELTLLSCPVTAACGNAVVDGGVDDCGGSIVGTNYEYTPTEAEGPGSCVAAVMNDADNSVKDSDTVTINEADQNPYFTSAAPTDATEGVAFAYAPTFDDDDLPDAAAGDPGYVSCVNITNNTCGAWLVVSGCDTSAAAGLGEADAPGSCSYDINIQDGLGAPAVQNVSLTLNEANQNPYWTTAPSDITLDGGAVYNQVNGAAADDDEPNGSAGDPGYIDSCSTANNTCGFVVNASGSGAGAAACTVSFTAGNAEVCTVDIIATDGDAGTAVQNITITVEQSVAIDCSNPGPNPVDELATIQCTVTEQGGTAVKGGSDDCNGTLAGGIYSYTPTEAEGPGSCTAGVELTENAAITDSDTVNINEVNQNPYWSGPAPSDITIDLYESYDSISASALDDDLPDAAAGNPGYIDCSAANNTCSFAVNVTGSGAGAADCNISFASDLSATGGETCTVDVVVTDGDGGSVSQNITINVNGDIYFVDGNNDDVGCQLWSDACFTVQGAVDLASSGDVIFVKTGTYTSGSTDPLLTMKDGVRVFGGFDGTETSLADRGDPTALPTILDGNNISNNVILADNVTNVGIDGFFVKHGYSDAASPSQSGAGMMNYHTTDLTVDNCTFYYNYAYINGGGMSNYGISSTVISNSVFYDNSSNDNGGGMHNYYSSPIISDSYFYHNYAYNGGGMMNYYYSSPTISDSYFYHNYAYNGGAIYNRDTDAIISDSIFDYNYAYRDGGAIANDDSGSTISDSIFDYNYAYSDGGAIANDDSDSTISNSIFYYNGSNDTGGAMYNYYSNPTISNSLFYENSTYFYGGAIYNWESDPTIGNSTFTDNYAYYYGGALANYYYSYPSISDSILYGDYAHKDYNEIYDDGDSATTIIYSDIMGGHAGAGNIDVDPLFVNGFYLSEDDAGQASDSPCIDAGSDTAENLGLSGRTTRTDGVPDSGTVDMGFHYEIP